MTVFKMAALICTTQAITDVYWSKTKVFVGTCMFLSMQNSGIHAKIRSEYWSKYFSLLCAKFRSFVYHRDFVCVAVCNNYDLLFIHAWNNIYLLPQMWQRKAKWINDNPLFIIWCVAWYLPNNKKAEEANTKVHAWILATQNKPNDQVVPGWNGYNLSLIHIWRCRRRG